MEERLDDALNVLRNHCEPQLGIQISNMDGSPYVGTSPVVTTPGAISQDNVTNEPPATVKLERTPLNSSKKMHIANALHSTCSSMYNSCGLREEQQSVVASV